MNRQRTNREQMDKSYLLRLCADRDLKPRDIARQYGKDSIQEMTPGEVTRATHRIITTPQLECLSSLCYKRNLDMQKLAQAFGKSHIGHLTKHEASEAITQLYAYRPMSKRELKHLKESAARLETLLQSNNSAKVTAAATKVHSLLSEMLDKPCRSQSL